MIRGNQGEAKPNNSTTKDQPEEDVYEKMCREEKERIKQRDEELAKKNTAKSLPMKIVIYGGIIIANYYIFKTIFDYAKNLNTTGDKTSTVK